MSARLELRRADYTGDRDEIHAATLAFEAKSDPPIVEATFLVNMLLEPHDPGHGEIVERAYEALSDFLADLQSELD